MKNAFEYYISEVFFIMERSRISSSVKKYIISFIAAFLLTAFLLAVLSVVFAFFPPHVRLLRFVESSSGYFSAFLSALFCARLCAKRGLLTGMACADTYMLLLIAAGFILFKNTFSPQHIIRIFAFSSVSGALGGIIGINFK